MPKMRVSLASFAAWSVSTVLVSAAAINSDDIAANVLIGQVYPSGHVYLVRFVPGRATSKPWPAKIMFRGLSNDDSATSGFLFARFAQDFRNSSKTFYIPGVEDMDEQHSACEDDAYVKNRSYNYISKDFFYAVVDYCDANQGVGLYSSSPNKSQSYSVIAFGTDPAPQNVTIENGRMKRPVSNQEQAEIDKKRAEMNGLLADCTTVPAYLDSAVVMATATIGEKSVRLSSYEDAGCGGHLSTIYVLDVIEKGDQLKRYDVRQYQGPI